MIRRRWTQAWVGGAVIGVVNGILRERAYGPRVGEWVGHQLSGVTAIAAFAAFFKVLHRRWPIPGRRAALLIGSRWLGMTVAFEFGFGRLVAKLSWRELLADYDLRHGRTWPLVLAWIALGPEVVRARSGG